MSAPVVDDSEDSTLGDVRWSQSSGALWGRRGFLVLLLLAVVAGGIGLLGVHTSTVSSSAGGYTLTVTYARTARAGWDVPLRFDVTSTGTLKGKKLAFHLDRAYLDLFETQGVNPDPSGEGGDATDVEWDYDSPSQGSAFAVEYDAYIQPTAQIGTGCTVSLYVDTRLATEVHFSTWLAP